MSHVRWFTCTNGWPKYLSVEERDGRFHLRVTELHSKDPLKMFPALRTYGKCVVDGTCIYFYQGTDAQGVADGVWYDMKEIPSPLLPLEL